MYRLCTDPTWSLTPVVRTPWASWKVLVIFGRFARGLTVVTVRVPGARNVQLLCHLVREPCIICLHASTLWFPPATSFPPSHVTFCTDLLLTYTHTLARNLFPSFARLLLHRCIAYMHPHSGSRQQPRPSHVSFCTDMMPAYMHPHFEFSFLVPQPLGETSSRTSFQPSSHPMMSWKRLAWTLTTYVPATAHLTRLLFLA